MDKPKHRSRKQLAISLYTSAIKNGFDIEDAIAHANAVMEDVLDTREQQEAKATVLEIMRELQ